MLKQVGFVEAEMVSHTGIDSSRRDQGSFVRGYKATVSIKHSGE